MHNLAQKTSTLRNHTITSTMEANNISVMAPELTPQLGPSGLQKLSQIVSIEEPRPSSSLQDIGLITTQSKPSALHSVTEF